MRPSKHNILIAAKLRDILGVFLYQRVLLVKIDLPTEVILAEILLISEEDWWFVMFCGWIAVIHLDAARFIELIVLFRYQWSGLLWCYSWSDIHILRHMALCEIMRFQGMLTWHSRQRWVRYAISNRF